MIAFRILVTFVGFLFPWKLRRHLLSNIFGYEIHPTARIGFSLVCPTHLSMAARAYIGHLNICKGLDLIQMGESSIITNLNWITGSPIKSEFFQEVKGRKSQLILHAHSAITNRHLIDCTDAVSIGEFSTFAGYRSQILTHSINLKVSRQSCAPITIGAYCFIGTNCVLLGGSCLPSYSILGASSILTKRQTIEYALYAGVPAVFKKSISKG